MTEAGGLAGLQGLLVTSLGAVCSVSYGLELWEILPGFDSVLKEQCLHPTFPPKSPDLVSGPVTPDMIPSALDIWPLLGGISDQVKNLWVRWETISKASSAFPRVAVLESSAPLGCYCLASVVPCGVRIHFLSL